MIITRFFTQAFEWQNFITPAYLNIGLPDSVQVRSINWDKLEDFYYKLN